jgi:hypothetical protein
MGTQLGIRRLTGAIGAEVSGLNLNAPLDETTFEDVHQAFLDHCLLVFRGQFLIPAAQVAFTHRWGEAVVTPYLKSLQVPDHPEIVAVPNLGKAKAVTEEWHSDSSLWGSATSDASHDDCRRHPTMRTSVSIERKGVGSYRTPHEAFHVSVVLVRMLLNPKGHARAEARGRGR